MFLSLQLRLCSSPSYSSLTILVHHCGSAPPLTTTHTNCCFLENFHSFLQVLKSEAPNGCISYLGDIQTGTQHRLLPNRLLTPYAFFPLIPPFLSAYQYPVEHSVSSSSRLTQAPSHIHFLPSLPTSPTNIITSLC